jgi:hypothetical protein
MNRWNYEITVVLYIIIQFGCQMSTKMKIKSKRNCYQKLIEVL